MKELSDVSGPLNNPPTPRPGIFQSRVFTFVQRQAHRLRDGLGLGWRQVRVSVQMTSQLFLLPLRWLQHLGVERQLPGQPAASALPPKPTIAVERILAEVAIAGHGRLAGMTVYEDWSAIDEREWDVSLLDDSQRPLTGTTDRPVKTVPTIRGLASRLVDRHLVLIDDHNQILDTLSPSQQQHIRQKIAPDLPVPTASAPPDFGPRSLALESNGRLPLPPSSSLATTPWQKLRRWWEFYRDYWQVQVDFADPALSPSPEAEALPPASASSAAGMSIITSTDTDLGLRTTSWSDDDLNLTAAKDSTAICLPQEKRAKALNQPFQPEWIEAPTRPLGYERSWLVRCLEWLDGLVLAIENWLLSCYQKIFHR